MFSLDGIELLIFAIIVFLIGFIVGSISCMNYLESDADNREDRNEHK